jgi:rRNA maturation protein Nop10
MEKSDKCDKCGSENTAEHPSVIEYEDGKKEFNYDTLEANCLVCGHEWIVVYFSV